MGHRQNLREQIGKRIRSRRFELRLTQNVLAQRLGVSYQLVQSYEHGEKLTVETIERIANALDVNFYWLLGRELRNGMRDEYDRLLTGPRQKTPNIITPSAALEIITETGFYTRQPQISTTVYADRYVKEMIGLARQGDLIAFKCIVAALIEMLIDAAKERGIAPEDICRLLSAESLELAARMHTGSDASFVQMARRSLSLVRTGAIEQ
jgi:transcriptional regulator with XRE-family HTH domain